MTQTNRLTRRTFAAVALLLPFVSAGCGGAAGDAFVDALAESNANNSAASRGTGSIKLDCTLNGEDVEATYTVVMMYPSTGTYSGTKRKGYVTTLSSIPAGGDASVEFTVAGNGKKLIRLPVVKDQTTEFNFKFGTEPANNSNNTSNTDPGQSSSNNSANNSNNNYARLLPGSTVQLTNYRNSSNNGNPNACSYNSTTSAAMTVKNVSNKTIDVRFGWERANGTYDTGLETGMRPGEEHIFVSCNTVSRRYKMAIRDASDTGAFPDF